MIFWIDDAENADELRAISCVKRQQTCCTRVNTEILCVALIFYDKNTLKSTPVVYRCVLKVKTSDKCNISSSRIYRSLATGSIQQK